MNTELTQIAQINKLKDDLFIEMCNKMLSHYSRLSGRVFKKINTIDEFFEIRKSNSLTLLSLLSKCHHIIYHIGSPVSIPGFLTRVATRKKKQTQPNAGKGFDEGEFLGVCHFRWDWKGQTLNEIELKALRQYLGYSEPKEFSSYEKEAQKFAKKNGIELTTIGDPEYKKYFSNDKEERYVFKLKLTRKKKDYTFTFGQSINEGANKPGIYDVLACLTKYDPETFENFCSEFAYDTDSREALKTYKAVTKEWQAVERLFGDILEELQEIQ